MSDPDEALQSANVGCASADDAVALASMGELGAEREYASAYGIAANPVNRPNEHALFRIVGELLASEITPETTLKELSLRPGDIFSESAKTAKSENWGYWTPALYLLSGTVAESGKDLCPFASDGCRLNCLLVSGHREMKAHTALEVTERLHSQRRGLGAPTVLSLLRTYAYRFAKEEFIAALKEQIYREGERAVKMGLRYGVRLNATSDIPWENEGVIQEFPEVPFYDYTKIPHRAMKFAQSQAPEFFSDLPYDEFIAANPPVPWPNNYHLSFSYSEVNMAWCLILLKMGVNVVIPFTTAFKGREGRAPWEFDPDGPEHAAVLKAWKGLLPETCFGHPVIDGDAYDIRFIDNHYWNKRLGDRPPFIVGLRVKGHYQREHMSKNGFFFDGNAAKSFGNDPGFIAEHLAQNMAEAYRQGHRGQIPPVDLAKAYMDPAVFAAFESALR
jgi:hypothetical protein